MINKQFLVGLKKAFEIFSEAVKKFRSDDCSIRGNAIAYAIIISIIPLLTIFIQLAKINRNIVQTNIALFLASYGISDTSEFLNILDEILARAETIAGIGFIFVLYSATNFFRNLEDTFNHIYQVKEKRPILYRFSLYLMAFILLPIGVICTSQIIQTIHYYFNSPEIRQVVLRQNKQWVVSSDGNLWIYSEKAEPFQINLKKKVTHKAPFREYFIDTRNNSIGYSWDVMETPFRSYELGHSKRFDLIGIVQTKKTIYTISSAGTLYYSSNEGQSWKYQQLVLHSETDTYSPNVRDIHITKQEKILLLIDEGTLSSILVRSKTGDWKHQSLAVHYKSFITIKNKAKNQIIPPLPTGLYLIGKGAYHYSPNDGKDWQGPIEEKYGDRKLQINVMQTNQKGDVFFAGNHGALWIHSRGNVYYPDLRAHFNQHVQGMSLYENGTGFLYGSGGLFRYTKDHGHTWHMMDTDFFSNKHFISHKNENVHSKKNIYLFGKEKIFIKVSKATLTNRLDPAGHAYANFKYNILSSTSWLRKFFVIILIEPLLLIFLLFTFSIAYYFIPNTKVYYASAIIGAIFSSISLMAFILVFRYWISAFSSTSYVYGVWATIPFGMLVILISTYIFLFGLELSFILQKGKTS